jgi:sugar phosphate isomerase/epimerase
MGGGARVRVGDGLHLTYCTNVHPGESLAEVRAALATQVLAVKRRVCRDRPFGVGLRLSARAAAELVEGGALDELHRWLDDHGLYVFTINGFPFGAFHDKRVKAAVYQPDWRSDERIAYSDRLALILARLLPSGVEGSVSTVPGGLRTAVSDIASRREMASRLRRHVAALDRLWRETGRTIVLALEPEPGCFLEVSDDVVAFFGEHLLGGSDEEAVRRHLGVCLDACHAAVEFEDAVAAARRFRAAGIRIGKLQLSTALVVDFRGDAETLQTLAPFAEDTYLHQVVERRGGEMRRWLDLPDAIAAVDGDDDDDRQWRIHFHVPIYRAQLGRFRNTQAELAALLAAVAETGCRHLEVETYTWGVMPSGYRLDVVDGIARELEWVKERL